MEVQRWDRDTPEDAFASFVDEVKVSPGRPDVLVSLLSERDRVYAGRSANATTRMRGYALAAFEQAGLPEAAQVYVIEELESGRDPYLVAAAAKAMRGRPAPSAQIVPFLFKAIENIQYVDDAVTFESYRPQWPQPTHTTALHEIFRTFAWLGAEGRSALPRLEEMAKDALTFSPTTRASIAEAIEAIRNHASPAEADEHCCSGPTELLGGGHVVPERANRAAVPTGLELEDQDGESLTYGDFFAERPSVLAFFYTRCMNPNKCSLTITKLARLQRAIVESGVQGRLRTAAITYDPGFDLGPRLRAYGANRGFVFDADNRFLRAPAGYETLHDYFELGVNFGPAVVNRHRIELFVLNGTGSIASTFARLQWDEHVVLQHAMSLLG